MTAAGAIGSISRADAALYYWQESPGALRYDPMEQPRRAKARRPSAKKDAVAEKDTSKKPQGPLIISVSISKQQVKVYDDNGLFAQAPVSSGMPGHSTPMGVFSVIQKHKWHHSNIYSGAPMPYMQRITWSGVALHAGVLPGYPASHGCIRMPTAFAIKMWNWTKMGARVLVTPGEVVPESFSHPLLATTKVAPQPIVADQPQPDVPVAIKADKGAPDVASSAAKSADANVVELRSTMGHEGSTQTRTADASSKSKTMTDAGSGTGDTSKADAAGNAKPQDASTAEDKVTDAKPSDANVRPVLDVVDVTTGSDTAKPTDAAASANADDSAAKTVVKVEPKIDPSKTEAAKAEAAKPDDKPADNNAKPAVAARAPVSTPADGKKDQTRVADTDKPVVAKPEPPKRAGQIAVFISRKDSKLYVRQNFSPLFEVPVTIAPSDRPLGTHVFTAEVDKGDPNALHWTVVSLPSARTARGEDGQRVSSRRARKNASQAEAKPLPTPDSPAEALDRITIPADAMARIVDAIATGGSIVVSDQGINQGETGEGTDFIVSLR